MRFYKYEGTGNDFVMIDDRLKEFPTNDIARIAFICDRRFGIGADGLILLQPHDSGHFYMQYFNSDGRESSMCGNGGRCFAKFIFDLGLARTEIAFEAIDGWHQAKYSIAGDIGSDIALQMISVNDVKRLTENSFELNTGSPHYVRLEELPIKDLEIISEAHAIRYKEPYKKEGINVNFLNLHGLKSLDIRTYERGVEDETLSCGTGATASAMALAIYNGLPEGKHQVNVRVKGGELKVQFHFSPQEPKFENVWLIGPAKQVFVGEIFV